MAKNVIYLGPVAIEPQTIDKVCTGTPLPGTVCYLNAAVLTTAAAAQNGEKLYVANNRREIGQDVATAYVAGDIANAYEPIPGQRYQVRSAAVTHAAGNKLALGASGRLTNVIAVGDVTQAYFDGTAGAFAAGDLIEVIWAGAGGTLKA